MNLFISLWEIDMSRTYRTCSVLKDYKKDYKPKDKCPKAWKRILSHSRKAKIRQAMKKENYDDIPIFCKENDWRWLA